jgi:hypothetical protein
MAVPPGLARSLALLLSGQPRWGRGGSSTVAQLGQCRWLVPGGVRRPFAGCEAGRESKVVAAVAQVEAAVVDELVDGGGRGVGRGAVGQLLEAVEEPRRR